MICCDVAKEGLNKVGNRVGLVRAKMLHGQLNGDVATVYTLNGKLSGHAAHRTCAVVCSILAERKMTSTAIQVI